MVLSEDCLFSLAKGHSNHEIAASEGSVFDPDIRPNSCQRTLADGQANTRAAILAAPMQSLEWRKDYFAILGVDADAIIADAKYMAPEFLRARNLNSDVTLVGVF